MLIQVYTVRVSLVEKRVLEALEGKRKKQATFTMKASRKRVPWQKSGSSRGKRKARSKLRGRGDI